MPRPHRPGEMHTQLVARIPAHLHKAVRHAAVEDGVTLQAWVGHALETHLRSVAGTEDRERAPRSA